MTTYAKQRYKQIVFQGRPALVEVLDGDAAINAVIDNERDLVIRDNLLKCIVDGMLICPKGAFIYDAETLKHIGVIQ